MITIQSIVRVRARIALLLGLLLVSLVVPSTSVFAAPARPQEISFASVPNAAPLERGASASAEAAVDNLARALSREHGYQPGSFNVELYRMPAASQADMETFFTTTLARDGWATAPALKSNGSTLKTIGWTRARGDQAVVGGYGHDGQSEQMFIIIVRASR
jgi:hypothetical protein